MRGIRPPALFELRAHGSSLQRPECRGLAPHPPKKDALVSTEARLARPVDIPKWSAWQDSHLQPFRLERNASSLGYTRVFAHGQLVPTVGVAPTLDAF